MPVYSNDDGTTKSIWTIAASAAASFLLAAGTLTADRTLTCPDASGIISIRDDFGTNYNKLLQTGSPTFVDVTLTGVLTVNGNITLGDASGDRVTQNAAITNLPNGLTYVVTHVNSSSETLLAARLDEDTSSSWSIVNGSSTDGVFAAKFQGAQSGTNTALNFTGRGTTDTGANPLLLFVSQIGSSQVAVRPCVAWWNLSTSMMEISAGGNFQLTGGTTSPVVATAATDRVSIVGFDRINTRHAAAGNRVEAIQSERGSPIYIGDDAIDFAATTALITVNATDLLSMTSSTITVLDAKNIAVGTTIGTKIGTDTSQLIGFWNVTPVAQYASAAGLTTGFSAATGTAVLAGSTFTGNTGSTAYTMSEVVRALKLCGIMAA